MMNQIKEILISILQFFGWAWWVEVATENPRCTYYFGPFMTYKEAESAKSGYIEDLLTEGAEGITLNIKRCKPQDLTIDYDMGERSERKERRSFSNQFS